MISFLQLSSSPPMHFLGEQMDTLFGHVEKNQGCVQTFIVILLTISLMHNTRDTDPNSNPNTQYVGIYLSCY